MESSTPVSGTRLCHRHEVNSELSPDEARDEDAFRQLLEDAFVSVRDQDYGFTISIVDTETQVKFKAYSGPTGPAYGGAPEYYETLPSGGYRLKPRVRSVLQDFEDWLQATSEE